MMATQCWEPYEHHVPHTQSSFTMYSGKAFLHIHMPCDMLHIVCVSILCRPLSHAHVLPNMDYKTLARTAAR